MLSLFTAEVFVVSLGLRSSWVKKYIDSLYSEACWRDDPGASLRRERTATVNVHDVGTWCLAAQRKGWACDCGSVASKRI